MDMGERIVKHGEKGDANEMPHFLNVLVKTTAAPHTTKTHLTDGLRQTPATPVPHRPPVVLEVAAVVLPLAQSP